MRWGIGVLTWNAPEVCRHTIGLLHAQLIGPPLYYPIVVLDNGSEAPVVLTGVDVIRHSTNLGAGGGLSQLVRALLERPIDAILFLEDDWSLVRPLSLAAITPLLDDLLVGQLRLGERPLHPGQKYYTYGLDAEAIAATDFGARPLVPYAHGHYQEFPSLWSNNPFACRRAVAERFLLTGLDELRMARPYYASGLRTRSTTPGHFHHHGGIRDRRREPGWKK